MTSADLKPNATNRSPPKNICVICFQSLIRNRWGRLDVKLQRRALRFIRSSCPDFHRQVRLMEAMRRKRHRTGYTRLVSHVTFVQTSTHTHTHTHIQGRHTLVSVSLGTHRCSRKSRRTQVCSRAPGWKEQLRVCVQLRVLCQSGPRTRWLVAAFKFSWTPASSRTVQCYN